MRGLERVDRVSKKRGFEQWNGAEWKRGDGWMLRGRDMAHFLRAEAFGLAGAGRVEEKGGKKRNSEFNTRCKSLCRRKESFGGII